MHFHQLHQQSHALLLANVWDAASARAAEAAGYSALGTSSAAIAAMLGYEDGEGLSFAELLAIVARIRAVSRLPLSVDMEAGYGAGAAQICANLQQLAELGVSGVNLEDSRVHHSQRGLTDAGVFAAQLRAIRAGLQASAAALFLNVRTDTFLLGVQDAQRETIARGRLYAAAGADGLFVPCMTAEADIRAVQSAVALPLNLMCMPDLPPFARLSELGVKRISMGNFMHGKIQAALQQCFVSVREQQSFDSVFDHAHH